MQNYHLIEIKTLPPTSSKPARVKLTSYRFHKSVIIDRGENDETFSTSAAYDFLIKDGFDIIGLGVSGSNGTTYAISTTFKKLGENPIKTIVFRHDDLSAWKKAESKKTRFENAGYTYVDTVTSYVTKLTTITYKVN